MILAWLIIILVLGGLSAWVLGRWSGRAARWVSLAALVIDTVLLAMIWRDVTASISLSGGAWLVDRAVKSPDGKIIIMGASSHNADFIKKTPVGKRLLLTHYPAFADLLVRIEESSKSEESEWLRLPGLFRRWELEQVMALDQEFLIEAEESDRQGTSLFAVYCRQRTAEGKAS